MEIRPLDSSARGALRRARVALTVRENSTKSASEKSSGAIYFFHRRRFCGKLFSKISQVRTTRGSGWPLVTRRSRIAKGHPLPRVVLTLLPRTLWRSDARAPQHLELRAHQR